MIDLTIQTQYGFARTVCACPACQAYCQSLSGMVSPADLVRWRSDENSPEHTEWWLLEALAASPGAVVLQQGQMKRIRTIVPRRRVNGRCLFLTRHGECAMHHTAPYGCAYFDSHMARAEADPRSHAALRAILDDWAAGGPYSQLWQALHAAGHTVEAPEAVRARQIP